MYGIITTKFEKPCLESLMWYEMKLLPIAVYKNMG